MANVFFNLKERVLRSFHGKSGAGATKCLMGLIYQRNRYAESHPLTLVFELSVIVAKCLMTTDKLNSENEKLCASFDL